MRAPPAPPATNEMNAASTSECLQMLLAASKCVSSEPENDELLERKLVVEAQGRKVGRSRGTPRSSVSVTPNSSGTATPTGEMEGPQAVEQWLERRKKQQSMAQSRYRSRQKQKQTDLKSELDRLRALALQYQLTVVDPDAMEEEEMNNGEGSPTLSDMDSSNSLSLVPPPTQGLALGTAVAPATPGAPGAPTMGDPSAPVQGLMHSWSVTSAPQLSLTPQAIAQRKYRAKLKMKRARLQRQVELYTRVLQAHMAKTGTPQPDILQAAEPQVPAPAPPQAQPQLQAFN